jgi:uncharacterized protein YndB with AHSA1/START domain
MSVQTRRIAAPASRVWDVLSDGWLYSGWVVGASHIRDVESTWPQVGAQLHHSVGSWPVMISDSTKVLESRPGERLVLQARGWPLGEARVEVDLVGDGDGCRVTITELPTNGPGRWLHNPLQDKALDARNRESLARLADMAEGGAAS